MAQPTNIAPPRRRMMSVQPIMRSSRMPAASNSGKYQGRLQSQEVGADFLQMRFAALDLLRQGAKIAEPPLERARREDRGGAGYLPGRIGRRLGFADGECRGHADVDALGDRQLPGCHDLPPHALGRRLDVAAGRAQASLGVADLEL